MTAALLEAHGVFTGAYVSPHLTSFAERIRIGDADLEPAAFGAAVQRAAEAAAKVDRGLRDGDRVTQFEVLTAAAFDELARRAVDVAVVEAGLGGRHDATGVLRAPIVALTNVGLEHTRWLGPTVADIAREKLAVVGPEATLVLGESTPEVEDLARATGARIVRGEADGAGDALPGYQRTNFGVACAAAREQLGELDPELVEVVARSVSVPGRLQIIGEHPLCVLDGAHNPSGAEALAAAPAGAPVRRGRLDPRRQGRGRDARRAAAALRHVRLHGGAEPAGALARDAGVPGGAAGRRRGDRAGAARGGRPRARAGRAGRGRRGHRLDLPDRRARLRAGIPEGLGAVNDRGPSVLGMIALVAVVVALTILIFFALGYAFGRMFL